MVRADNVVYEYIRRDNNNEVADIIRAVDGVSFNVKKGQFISIVGHNGSGKSTLAKHLNALLVPGEGTVWINGIDTKDSEHILEIRQNVGMIFQNPDNQIVAGIVEEDVAFAPENMGVPPEEIRKRVDDSLKTVGMYIYRNSSPNRLSGGQKQLVAIAGVLAMKPKCIVLDEPTSMIDPAGRKKIIEAVTMLNRKEGITVILITHRMEETVRSDVIFVMKNGKIVLQDSPVHVYQNEELLNECNLEVPKAVLIANRLRKKGIAIPDSVLEMNDLYKAIMLINRG